MHLFKSIGHNAMANYCSLEILSLWPCNGGRIKLISTKPLWWCPMATARIDGKEEKQKQKLETHKTCV